MTLNATRLIKVDGVLSANGQSGGSTAGGGAGGSIYVVTDEIDGSGSIEVCHHRNFVYLTFKKNSHIHVDL